jgi:DNA-binding SARP family transcriptional activator
MNESESDKQVRDEADGDECSLPIVLTISLFGTFRVAVNGEELTSLSSRRSQWLLAYLTLRSGVTVPRETIAATFWPDSLPEQALYNLRRALVKLRSEMGAGSQCIKSPDTRSLCIHLSEAEVDVLRFDLTIRRGDKESLAQAVSIYKEALLPGCSEAWITPERVVREQDYLVALERLAEDAQTRQDWPQAVSYLERILVVAPERESALRTLLNCFSAMRDNVAAVARYRDYRIQLHESLGLQPAPETRAIYERIKSQLVRDGKVSQRPAPMPFPSESASLSDMEPVGGAVPLNSSYYIERKADTRFFESLSRGDSIVLLKGPRQVGKTSLLARGLQRARNSGFRVVVTDLQKLSPAQLTSTGSVLLTFAHQLAGALELNISPETVWSQDIAANENFERFLRRYVLGPHSQPLVWALDEVDHLFPCQFSSEIFGLFRSWHNDRALDPDGPWSRLTLAMAYATEAYLFITDLNQSPFNVGTRLTLEDFTESEVAVLNQKYGRPLTTNEERSHFTQLLGGHPYLLRKGFQELVTGDRNLAELEASAPQDNGPFSDHLRRLLFSLRQDAALVHAVKNLLSNESPPSLEAFYRLQSAGVLRGNVPEEAGMRCDLYAHYLGRHLE